MRQDKTSWGAALKLGALVAVLFFLMQANDWNSIRAGYDTHQAYSSFVTAQLAQVAARCAGHRSDGHTWCSPAASRCIARTARPVAIV